MLNPLLFQPASNQQIAQLDVLQKELKYLQNVIYFPASAMISIIATPIVMHFVFFAKNAPLHFIYQNFQELIINSVIEYERKFFSHSQGSSVQDFYASLETSYIEAVCKSISAIKYCHTILKKVLNSNRSVNDLARASHELKLPVEKLRKYLNIYDNEKDNIFSKILSPQARERMVLSVSNKFFHFLTSCLGVGIKFLMVDVLLRRFLYSDPALTIVPYITYQKDKKDAEYDILNLKEKQIELSSQAKKIQIFSTCLSIVGLPYMFYNIANYEENAITPIFSVTYLATASVFLNASYRQIKSWFENRALHQNLIRCQSLLNEITAITGTTWSFKKNITLEMSYLWVELNEHETLKYYLWLGKIVPQPTTNNQVIVTADQVFNNKHIKEIVENFKEAVTRFEKIKIFSKQLNTLLKKFALTIQAVTPAEDEKHLPIIEVEVEFKTLNKLLAEILEESENEIKIQDQNLKISGFQPWTKEEFSQVRAKLKVELLTQLSKPFEDYFQTQPPSLSKPLRTRFAKSQLINFSENKSNVEVKRDQAIQWKNDRYQPGNPRCPVKKMRTNFSSNVEYFGIFKLKPNHMPQGSSVDLYGRLSQTILEGKIGADGQGWKLIAPELHLDFITGKMVPCTAKYRVFYRQATDMRLYGYKDVVKTKSGPKVLINVVNITQHAHL